MPLATAQCNSRSVEATLPLEEVEMLDLDAVLHQVKQLERHGAYHESIPLREKVLAAIAQRDRVDPAEVALLAEELVRIYCCLALQLLNANDFSAAFDLLVRADHVTSRGEGMLFARAFDTLRGKACAAVQNNFGLFYFRTADYEAAVTYLTRAAELESRLGPKVVDNPGGTLLNLAQALMACELNGASRASPVLEEAILALRLQMQHATVSVQVEEATRLAIHAHKLLGKCHEECGTYHKAADAFGRALQLSKSLPGANRKPTAEEATSQRLLLEDQRRCQEKAARLPKVPLRTTLPAAVVAPRDQRGTKENLYRLQVTRANPGLQHQRIVTSTTADAQPMLTTAVGHFSREAPKRIAATREISSTPEGPPTIAVAAAQVGGAGTHEVDEHLVPIGARDARLASTSRFAPLDSVKIFRASDKGLEEAYYNMDEKYQTAFDALAKLSSDLPRSSRRDGHLARTTPAVFAEERLFGKRDAVATHTERSPAVSGIVPSTALAESTLTNPLGLLKSVGKAHHKTKESDVRVLKPSKPPGKPMLDDASLTRSGTRPATAPDRSSSASLIRKVTPVQTPTRVVVTQSGTDAPAQKTSGRDASSFAQPPNTDDLEATLRTLSAFVLSQMAARHVLARSRQVAEELRLRQRLQLEARQKAQAEADVVLQRERLKMQRQLDEAKLLYVSRRRSGEPLQLFSSVSEWQAPDPTRGESDVTPPLVLLAPTIPSKSNESLHAKVSDLMRVHVACAEETKQSAEATELARESVVEIRQQNAHRRLQALIVVQEYVRALMSQRCVQTKLESWRTKVLELYAVTQLRRISACKVSQFLRRAVTQRRDEAERHELEVSELRRKTRLQWKISPFVRCRLSQVLRARMQMHQLLEAARLIQRVGGGLFERREMKFRQREHRAAMAHVFEAAAKTVHRALRLNMSRARATRRWEAITADNLKNRRQYAATLLQAVWRRWHYGSPLEQEWRQRLAIRKRAEALALQEKQYAAELLVSTIKIQRSYRLHLARRQRQYRNRSLQEKRRSYFVSEYEAAAARTLQAFSRIVRARRVVRQKRATMNAELRCARIVYELSQLPSPVSVPVIVVETPARNPCVTDYARLLQRLGRGFAGRMLLMRLFFNSLLHARSSSDCLIGSMCHLPSKMPSRSAGSSFSAMSTVSRRSSSRAAPSPPLYAPSTSESMNVSCINESYIRNVIATVERPDQSVTSLWKNSFIHPVESQVVIDVNSVPLSEESITSFQLPVASRHSSKRSQAARRIIRFFRIVLRKRRAREYRTALRDATIRDEAARFIQDAWRRYRAKKQLRCRISEKRTQQRRLLESESAAIIQRSFRRFVSVGNSK